VLLQGERRPTNERIYVCNQRNCKRDISHGAKQICRTVHPNEKNVANYLQCTVADEGYLVVETIGTGKQQIIVLPPPVDANAMDADDQKIIREEAVRAIAKKKVKLDNALKKGFATVYDQCSLEVRDKLEASDEWDKVQRKQLLHDLISKIERICIGFDDH